MNYRDFLDVAINVGTIILAVSLLIRVFSEQEVKDLLQDDALSLFIGVGAQIFLSLENHEIKKYFNIYYYNIWLVNPSFTKYINQSDRSSAKK